MRRLLTASLIEEIEKNKKIWVLTGDLGYSVLEPVQIEFPYRFINCGSAEQGMLDIAVGLALKGQIPFCYSITTFLLYRPFETIRNYIDHEKIPVKLVGIGRDREYGKLGFSHWSEDAKDTLKLFKNIKSYFPKREELPELISQAVADPSPYFISISKK